MAEIIPFKGFFFNPDKVDNINQVIAPPFDIISKEEQDKFHASSPFNITWLTLNKSKANDTSQNNRYTRAAAACKKWITNDILKTDSKAAFYLTSHEFSLDRKKTVRYGLIGLVKLEPFEKGIVLPHEKTFSGIKSERLELIKACKANFSAIFSLYSDHGNLILNRLKKAISDRTPFMEFNDYMDHGHRVWRITDMKLHQYLTKAMQDKHIYIADGHHRYETALNYRNWLAENSPDFGKNHPANYVMMYLCSMEDPGLIILPAHRMLDEVPKEARESLIPKAKKYFDVTIIPYDGNLDGKARNEFLSILQSNISKNCIGVYMKDQPELYLLTLKPGIMEKMFKNELHEAVINIDVTVLTRLIFMELLGFDRKRLNDEKLIAYSSIAEDAIDAISAGFHDITFILNPTKIHQVQEIAENRLIMPRKATYFYPKVITGHIINSLNIKHQTN